MLLLAAKLTVMELVSGVKNLETTGTSLKKIVRLQVIACLPKSMLTKPTGR